jgi:hypothetical protein
MNMKNVPLVRITLIGLVFAFIMIAGCITLNVSFHFVDQNGIPLANDHVIIEYSTSNYPQWPGNTDENGNSSFNLDEPNSYSITIKDLKTGQTFSNNYVQVNLLETEENVPMRPIIQAQQTTATSTLTLKPTHTLSPQDIVTAEQTAGDAVSAFIRFIIGR